MLYTSLFDSIKKILRIQDLLWIGKGIKRKKNGIALRLISLFNYIQDFINKTILILEVLAGGDLFDVGLYTISFDQFSLRGIGLPRGDGIRYKTGAQFAGIGII